MTKRVMSFKCLWFCCFILSILSGVYSGIGSWWGGCGVCSWTAVERDGGRWYEDSRALSHHVLYVWNCKGHVSFIITCSIFFCQNLCFDGELCSWACMSPAGVVTLPVGTSQCFNSASSSYRAGLVVCAYSDSKKWFNIWCFLTVCRITHEEIQTRVNTEGKDGSSTSGLHAIKKNHVIRHSIYGEMGTLMWWLIESLFECASETSETDDNQWL